MVSNTFSLFQWTIQCNQVNAGEDESSVNHLEEKNSYFVDEPVPYIDSYGNYYANWSPELYQKYGLPQEYYQPALHDSKKSVRRQGPYDMMTNMFGEEAGVLKMIID